MSRVTNRVIKFLSRSTGIVERRWRNLPNHLYCFNYHRIGDRNNTPYDPNVFSCDTASFDEQVALIRKHFRLLTLDELIDIANSDKRIDERVAILTFDDGYIDNYTEALPVLTAHGASAIFFVTCDFVGSDHIPWWDRVAWWVTHATTSESHIPELGIRLPPKHASSRDNRVRTLLNAIKKQPDQIEENLKRIETSLRPLKELPTNPALFMNWDQLRSLDAAGMYIGSHTQSHQILSSLNAEKLRSELTGSKGFLENQIHIPIRSLAYPVGKQGTFNASTIAAAEDAGYEVAFTFEEASNILPLKNKLEISRIGIDSNPSLFSFKQKVTSVTVS